MLVKKATLLYRSDIYKFKCLLLGLLPLLLLLIFPLPGLAVSDVENNAFYVDLTKCPTYAVMGYDPSYLSEIPVDAVHLETDKLRAFKSYFPGYSARPFLSPFNEQNVEFTIIIPFTLNATQMKMLETEANFQPGLYLAGIGANWEIYINGALVRSEMHINNDGSISEHRSMRAVNSVLEEELFREGENLLTFRIIGPPSYVDTGLFYASPYYIGNYSEIHRTQVDYMSVLFCTVYIFVGFYHLLLFIMRRNDRENLYYGLFSAIAGIYFITRSPVIYLLIKDTAITQKLEYSAVYALIFCLGAFLEHLSYRRILLPTRIYGVIAAVLIVAQLILPIRFSGDALIIWQILALLMFIYMVIYDTIYTFIATIRRIRTKTSDEDKKQVFQQELFGSPLGNVVITLSLLMLTAIYDLLDSLILHTGIVITRFSFFLFTVGIAVTLARRYANQYSRANEAKIELEQSNASLEFLVEERTRELAEQVQIAESASRAKSAFMATDRKSVV